MEENRTPPELALARLRAETKQLKLPFLSALIFGIAAHMFAFTNKLVNADEIESLFGKGATVTSGRWGLESVKLLFPDYSLPWLWGLISLLLLAVSVCLIVRLFDIRGGLIQVILAGLIISFPSETGTLCFMFTSSAYALSFLFAVLSVCLFCRGGKTRRALSIVFLALSLGIYQAYIALAASLYLVYIIKLCLDGDARRALKLGIGALLMMLASLTLYAAVTYAVFLIGGAEFNDYVKENANTAGLLARVRMAYDFFVYYLSYREYALVTGELSRYLHIALLALCALGIAVKSVKSLRTGDWLCAALLIICAALLPLAVNCMFLVMAKESIHTLVIYSFVAVYVLAAVLLESVFAGSPVCRRASRDVVYLALACALISNVYFANEVYLEMYLEYENAYAFYSILLSRAEETEGFDENCKLALIGYQDNAVTKFDELDLGYITGPSRGLINIYSRENFIRRYLGSEIPLASDSEIVELETTEEFAAMAEYPYYGSVKKIGDYIVVKLG